MKLSDFIPGELEITSKEFGIGNLFKFIGRSVWSYKRTMFYILRHVGFRDFISFLYTKTFVPTGSGAGGAAYFFIGPLVRKYPFLYRKPICIEIEVTTVCNKKCILCEHTWWDEKPENLSLEEFKHILDMIPSLRWFGLTGEGDPFLNKDIIPILRYAKNKGMSVWLDESFDLLNEDISKQLVEMGLDGVMWSMDAATREVYEKFKVGCDFERTINNVKGLLKAKKAANSPLPEIIVRSIACRDTIEEMPKIVDMVSDIAPKEDYGDTMRIQYVGVLDFSDIQEKHLPEFPAKVVDETKRRSIERDMPVIFAHTECGNFPSINKCLNWMEPYIFMKGYVVPCCAVMMSNKRDYLRSRSFGNVFKTSFMKIWDSSRYHKFRGTVNKATAPVPQFCLGCRAYDHKERLEKYGVEKEL